MNRKKWIDALAESKAGLRSGSPSLEHGSDAVLTWRLTPKEMVMSG